MKRFRDDSIKLFKVARGSIASGILLYHDLLKSNEHRAYSYIGLTDFFPGKVSICSHSILIFSGLTDFF